MSHHSHKYLVGIYRRYDIMAYEFESLTHSAKMYLALYRQTHKDDYLRRAINHTNLALSILREQRKLKRV